MKFFHNTDISSFSIMPVGKREINNITLSLSPLKAIGPNRIPAKILKLINNDLSNQLIELFSFSYSLTVFSSFLKSGKVIPIFEKR